MARIVNDMETSAACRIRASMLLPVNKFDTLRVMEFFVCGL